MIYSLKNIFSTVIDWIFPPRKSEGVATKLTYEHIISLPKPHNNLPPDTYALYSYKNPLVTSLIWEIKYHKNNTVLSLIAPFLADLIQDEYMEKALFTHWDRCLLLPVPSTKKHMRDRGYAHTEFICEKLITLLPPEITYTPHVLIKTVDTPLQHKLHDRDTRLNNLKNTQTVVGIIPPHTAVILIDDVTTTGATLVESRRALTDAGVKDIFAFTIAH